jgi:hypothetical protein
MLDNAQKQMHYIIWDIETLPIGTSGTLSLVSLTLTLLLSKSLLSANADSFVEFASIWENMFSSPYIPVGLIDYDTSYEDRLKQVLSVIGTAYNKWEQEGLVNGYVSVRYAYEMFDGSIVAHSAPVLIHIRGKVTDKYSGGMNVSVAFLNSNTRVYLGIDAGELHYSISAGNSELISIFSASIKVSSGE